MELRTLRYFLAVAREENMTGAAAALHISQPALSYQIAELEKELGRQLFIRTGRKMLLTEEGMFLRSRAEEILSISDETVAAFQNEDEEVYGDIYIGAAESVVMHDLAEVISQFKKDYPKVCFHIYSGILDDVSERLNRGTVDFAVVVEPFTLDKCEMLTMPKTERLGVVVHKNNPLAAGKSVTVKDLYDQPLILTNRVHLNKDAYADLLGIPAGHLNVAATGNLIYNMAVLAEHGIGAAVTLEGLIGQFDLSSLVFLPFEPDRNRRIAFVWKQYRPFSRPAKLFLERVRQAIG